MKKLFGMNHFFIVYSLDFVKIQLISGFELCMLTEAPKN